MNDGTNKLYAVTILTCRNVGLRDLYVVVDAEGVTDSSQNGPQLIY